MKTKHFIMVGFIVATISITVYSTIGSLWWKILG